MVHGQAIGIPFRRRKGEQAPPPPKEVAWNPTIESNLPYKEVKYFKFVEGAGWQALNIGEILPVGQRVMIRIVMTEPYYEVSKAVSSQMTNIQIGKNGVSECDIVGALTVYSPQILTVTIGVDKNYVQWNPVVESNAKYASISYLLRIPGQGTVTPVIGQYYPILSTDTSLVVYVATNGADEVANLTINGQEPTSSSIHVDGRFKFEFPFNESPQNINITIDEYIRFEDIVQAYPLFFEFTDENGNLISWGGKAKVGSTITRTKGVAYANLLESLYTVTNPRLNNVPLTSAEHVVEKSMVFTCTATWKLSNEPNCILGNQILPIPNSSYKYLGYQPDLSGHGNHGVFNNFEFAGMSGANGYLQNFSEWTKASGVSSTDSVISSSNNLVAANGWIAYVTSGTVIPTFKVEISGIPVNGNLRFEGSDQVLVNGVNTIQGLTTTKITGFYISNGYDNDWSNLKIKQIGEYEGAICFNGVNNCMTIPALEHGGKQVLMKVNWQSNVGDAILYDQRGGDAGFAIYNGAVVVGGLAIAYRGRNVGGSTYIDGVLNNHIECSQLRNITHNIIELYDPELGVGTLSPRIGFSNTNINYAQMALFAFMSFPEISPEEEIKDLNDIVGIAGGYVERPEYYWDAYGKSNSDADRATIIDQVSKEAVNALTANNFAFNEESGYGGISSIYKFATVPVSGQWQYYASNVSFEVLNDGDAVRITEAKTTVALFYIGNPNRKAYYKITGVSVGKGIKFGSDGGNSAWSKIIEEDGIYEIDWSLNVNTNGDRISPCIMTNGWRGQCDITIEQVSQYQNGLVSDGVEDYLINTIIPAFTDFTVIAKRKFLNIELKLNESFCMKGDKSYPGGVGNAFVMEYFYEKDPTSKQTQMLSFGGQNIAYREEYDITWCTPTSYNNITINRGEGGDTVGLSIGKYSKVYWKGVFYKMMLYSKTIDMLSINALKNLFALDILIDINHPIFKK